MKIENSFEVAAPPAAAWDFLMDVHRVIPCMPGATLDEVLADNKWKATMQVKVGPIGLTFATDLTREEADEAALRTTLVAKAREVRNRGNASATIESSLTAVNGGTHVDIVTEVALTGTVAQYGRGMIQDISSQLVGSFARCLETQLAGAPEAAQKAVAAQEKPISGLSLFFGSLGRRATRLVKRVGRLFRR
jgi:uncharacterized protein